MISKVFPALRNHDFIRALWALRLWGEKEEVGLSEICCPENWPWGGGPQTCEKGLHMSGSPKKGLRIAGAQAPEEEAPLISSDAAVHS